MKKFTCLILAVVCVLACFTMTACNNNKETYSAWNIEVKQNTSGDKLEYYAVYKITAPKNSTVKNLSDFIINLSDIDEKATIGLAFSSSSAMLASSEQSTLMVNSDLEKNNGWVKIISGSSSLNYSYVEISVTEKMNINEIVLVSTENKKLNLELVLTGIRPEKGSSSKKEWTKDEIDAQISNGEITTSPLNLIDEQDKYEIDVTIPKA